MIPSLDCRESQVARHYAERLFLWRVVRGWAADDAVEIAPLFNIPPDRANWLVSGPVFLLWLCRSIWIGWFWTSHAEQSSRLNYGGRFEPLLALGVLKQPLSIWKVCRDGQGVEHGWTRPSEQPTAAHAPPSITPIVVALSLAAALILIALIWRIQP